MQDYIAYRKSISQELMAIKDRVRNFVSHWPEDGHYKEVILRNALIEYLPQTVSVGTGFVIGDNEPSGQIDIIVYLNSHPPLFHIDDFVIVAKESVVGIIEVKTKLGKNKSCDDVIKNAHKNGKLIGDTIFNGVFSYESGIKTTDDFSTDTIKKALDSIKKSLNTYPGYVNNIAFGEHIFARYWPANSLELPRYCYYKLEDLAFGYFISNLVETAYKRCGNIDIPEKFRDVLYPIEGGKIDYRVDYQEINQEGGAT
jgi:hypothetical protein